MPEAPQVPDDDRFPPLDARAPQDEFLVLDADTEQQYVIDMVRAGDSLVVSTPPGTGQTQTAINAISPWSTTDGQCWWWGSAGAP